MRLATKPELLCYALVVAYSLFRVVVDGMQFSAAAAPAIIASGADVLHVAPPAPGHAGPASSVLHLPRALVGWWQSTPRDVTDRQWTPFRENLRITLAAMTAFVLLSRMARRLGTASHLWCNAAFSLVFIVVAYGPAGTFWMLLLAGISYLLSKAMAGTQYGPYVIWGWHSASFLFIRAFDGLHFGSISGALAWMDEWGGMLRWHIYYNFLVLRLVSFAMDLHWARLRQHQSPPRSRSSSPHRAAAAPAKEQLQDNSKGGKLWPHSVQADPKARVEHPLPQPMYHALLFFAYCFYPPLCIAGPVVTFNDFATQVVAPPDVPAKQVLAYGARWLLAVGMLEVFTRTLYFHAIAQHKLLDGWVDIDVTSYHFVLTSFWVLVLMWLKFVIIWRFFRLVALADGIDAPENMGRCVCNTFDIEGFWRSWHCSFNRWLVRYVYVPLGGNKRRVLNIWPVFLFVAAWHDLELRMLHWALLMPAALAPELIVKALARRPWVQRHADKHAFRHLAAVAATVSVLGLMSANLVGFVVGLDGLLPLVEEVLGQAGTAVPVVLALYCNAQLGFALRALEAAALAHNGGRGCCLRMLFIKQEAAGGSEKKPKT